MFQETGGVDKEAGGKGKQVEEKIDLSSLLTGSKQLEVLRTNLDGIFSSTLSSFELLERQASIVSKTFGGTKLFSEDIKRNIAEAGPAVVQLGGKLTDVSNMQLSVMTNLGTQAMFNQKEFANLYGSVSAVSSASEDIGKKTGEITKKFVDAGYSIHAVSSQLLNIVNSAKELGVASEAVFTQVSKNIEKIDMFHFEGGIKGMAEMAAKSTLLRIDMSDTLDVARKLFKPEEAIKMSAQFQQLGVSVSELLDPMKLMDMARNAPELLQQKLGEAFSQLTKFNKETGQMEVPSGAVDFFMSFGDVLGKTPEQLMQWGKSVGDLSRKMKEIKFSPDFEMSEEMKERIAALSHLAEEGSEFEGRYIVNIGGKEKLSSELSKDDINAIKEASAPAKSGAEVAKNSLDVLRQINGVLEAQRDLLALQLVSNKSINAGIKEVAAGYLVGARTQAELLGLKPRDVGGTTVYDPSQIGKTISGVTDNYLKPIMEAFKELDFEKAETLFTDFGKAIAKGGADKLSSLPELMSRIAKEEKVSVPEKWVQLGTKLLSDITGTTSEVFSLLKNSKFAADSLDFLGNASKEVTSQFNKLRDLLSKKTETKESETKESESATPSEESEKKLKEMIEAATSLKPKSPTQLESKPSEEPALVKMKEIVPSVLTLGDNLKTASQQIQTNITNITQPTLTQPISTTNFDLVPQRIMNSEPLNYSPSSEFNELSLSNAFKTPSKMELVHTHTVGGDINLKADNAKISDLVRNLADDRSFIDHLSENLTKYNSDWGTLKGGK